MSKYLLAIDAGTGSIRAVIFALDGTQIACEQAEWFHKEDPRYPGSMDFDWKFNWDLACKCIKGAIAKAGIDPHDIAGVSTTCMREGIVLYDENYNEIWACANVDARANDEVLELFKIDAGLEMELYAKSGQTFALNALPRILWVKNKQPDVYEKIRYVGMFNDWLILKLTGALAVDPSNGSTSGLFDLNSRAFDPSIARKCGLRDDIFPATIECGEYIASVNAKGAVDSGLAEGTKVIVGGGDAQLGCIGVGVVNVNEAAIFGGSFWQYEYNSDKAITDKQGRVRVNCHAIPKLWQFEALAFKPGLVLRWYRDAFCEYEKEKAKELGCDPYELLNEKAKDIPAGSYGMLCAFSDVMNFTSWKHAAPTFSNFALESDKFNRFTFYKAILENTALIARGHVDLVYESTGKKPDSIIFGGGASKSPLWSQILADCLGIEIKVPVVKEATALGAAILAAVGLGLYKDLNEAVAAMVHMEKSYIPNKDNHEVYTELYATWRKFYKTQLDLACEGTTKYMWSAPEL